MLHIGTIVYSRIVSIPTICTTINSDNDTGEFLKRVKNAAIYSFIDTVLVGGIVFFSSMVATGYDNLLVNVKISLISSVITAGLTFFTEMRNKIKTDDKDNTTNIKI